MTRKLLAKSFLASVFLPDGKPPREGDLFRNPEMAWAFG